VQDIVKENGIGKFEGIKGKLELRIPSKDTSPLSEEYMERERKRMVEKFQREHKGVSVDEAKSYLHLSDYNYEAAEKQLRADQDFEKKNKSK